MWNICDLLTYGWSWYWTWKVKWTQYSAWCFK